MSGIKSLADELRATIKNEVNQSNAPSGKVKTPKTKPEKKSDAALELLFAQILAHELTGKEKLLIRLDDKTVFLLKQLKVIKGIDMNKLISFCLQIFLREHPELIQIIKENIKTIEL